ncbi:MAG: hypothetical protein ACR652_20130 [Methylocystis sp.]|uniref:hypothetical protein n=1 Tax=Methylocystis sp. TaxID=1911079 RepID=UPI003DA64C66
MRLLHACIFCGSGKVQPMAPGTRILDLLATTSCYAYAVSEADEDQGRARAQACLNAAAAAERGSLGALELKAGDIEAYVAPERPEDGYLLIRTRNGAIVAFRDTAPPPVSQDAVDREAAAERRGRDQLARFSRISSSNPLARRHHQDTTIYMAPEWGRFPELDIR